jgi:exodeoxyribonuclease VII large subunit
VYTGPYLSISELCSELDQALLRDFPRIYFQGEVQGLNRHDSGHFYFSLKDPAGETPAVFPCVMWKNAAQSLPFDIKNGALIEGAGRFSLYRARGTVQLQVLKARLAGEGTLQKRFLELKERLEKEGLFDASRKRALPYIPKAIGIVTAATGAVIQDIRVRLEARFPCVPVFVAPTRVQGEGACQQIKEAIELLNEHAKVDVIIVARGGGSLEDLWAFNEEIVARAIFSSRIPVISAVGHETDTTLADFVADVRAPTPTAAADLVVPDRHQLLREIDAKVQRLLDTDRWAFQFTQRIDDIIYRHHNLLHQRIKECRWSLDQASARVASIHPQKVFDARCEQVRYLSDRLLRAADNRVLYLRRAVGDLERRVAPSAFLPAMERHRDSIATSLHSLLRATDRALVQNRQKLNHHQATLQALSPERVLERGYALVEQGGMVVSSTKYIRPEDSLTIRWADGERKVQLEAENQSMQRDDSSFKEKSL